MNDISNQEQASAISRNMSTRSIRIVILVLVLLVVLLGGALVLVLKKSDFVFFDSSFELGRLAGLEQKRALLERARSEKVPDTTVDKSLQVDLPAVAFIPDVFSEEEKQNIRTGVLNAFIDWDKETVSDAKSRMVAVYVEKLDSTSLKYGINYITGDGGWGGFAYGTKGEPVFPIWTPGCMGLCKFSETFVAKYPEVIQEYKRQNPDY